MEETTENTELAVANDTNPVVTAVATVVAAVVMLKVYDFAKGKIAARRANKTTEILDTIEA